MNEYDIGQVFKEIEEELISSMMRNMKNHKGEEDVYKFNWPMWQAEQLKSLEKYRITNQEKFTGDFVEINRTISELIQQARQEGGMKEEIRILKTIQKGHKTHGKNSPGTHRNRDLISAFFKSNDKKIDALIRATQKDFEKAETAMLRMANDQYRKIIFKAQVYANSGAGSYKQAVDMATKDFLSAGINCIEYKNGARHTMSDYSEMAIRTANKRAAMTGAGEKRNEYGIHTVIINRRSGACEKCLPFVGVVFIDDVWSGGNSKDGDYPLLSSAISAGLFHPNCKDGTSTYYSGISQIEPKYTKAEMEEVLGKSKAEAKQKYVARQAEKFKRMAKHSLDKENKKMYQHRAVEWSKRACELTQDERGAVIRYISPDSYILNDKLRRDEALTEREKDWIMKLNKALEKLPYYEGNLNRSLIFVHDIEAKNFYEEIKTGGEYIPSQYLSATKAGFYDEDAQVQIYIKNAKKAKDLGDMNDMEMEVVYPIGSKFKVLNKVKQGDKFYILLEEAE